MVLVLCQYWFQIEFRGIDWALQLLDWRSNNRTHIPMIAFWLVPLELPSMNTTSWEKLNQGSIHIITTPLKTNMTLGKSPCSIGHTSSNDAFSSVMLIFQRCIHCCSLDDLSIHNGLSLTRKYMAQLPAHMTPPRKRWKLRMTGKIVFQKRVFFFGAHPLPNWWNLSSEKALCTVFTPRWFVNSSPFIFGGSVQHLEYEEKWLLGCGWTNPFEKQGRSDWIMTLQTTNMTITKKKHNRLKVCSISYEKWCFLFHCHLSFSGTHFPATCGWKVGIYQTHLEAKFSTSAPITKFA